MLTFKQDNNVFRYRSVAVAIKDGCVLIHKQADTDYWSLPGGRCEFHETSAETIAREMEEELGEKITVTRLLWVSENFYSTKRHKYHEVAFYYLIEFDDRSPLMDLSATHIGHESHVKLIFAWRPINKLDAVNLKPDFLIRGLQHIPEQIEHIISLD
ncbi:NUDIX hydrolase [candidate division KSB1 bacterium]|nr:NUDIX hydrolase [candidate division KSB1 bacterium]